MHPINYDSITNFMQSIPVIDGHCDAVLNSIDDGDFLSDRKDGRHVDAPRMIEGRISAFFFACWVHPDKAERSYPEKTYALLDELHTICERQDNPFEMANTTEQLRRQNVGDKCSIIPCVEGGHAIKDDIRHLRNFARLGVKYMTLTWMNNNEWADGSGDRTEHAGLTDRGKEIIQEMNRTGIIVDVSHASEETFRDAVATSEKPVIASHSCCRALCDHHRNLTDEQIQRLADNGGVIGICFYPGYLDEEYRKELDRYEEEENTDEWIGRLPEDRRPEVEIRKLVQHVDHAVELVGVNHVALGSDFDGVAALPAGINDCSDYPRIIEALFEKGFEREEVRKIAGGNFLRIIDQTEPD